MRNHHRPLRAWTIGFLYFTMCWLVAYQAGAVELLEAGISSSSGEVDSGFWALTSFCLVGAFVGYWVIWPLGTRTHGRRSRPAAAVTFGVIHGASEGSLYIAFWLVISDRISHPVGAVAATVLAIALFNSLWRSFVWDVWVTPEHNDPDWNLRKILFVHLPVLMLVLTHLSLYQDAILFLGFETVALVGSALFMRMPWPTD